ncbi:MAG: triphosphoribosyl-dephospho-CoA synthase MdcB [Terrimicrobiaceae bacterium]
MSDSIEGPRGWCSPEFLADLAISALVSELELFPKPGLVSPVDSGSHHDMDYALLRTSAICLRGPFRELARAGADGASFSSGLVPIGLQAERLMMEATRGINTHRGAIFSLGLLVAAAASVQEKPVCAEGIREAILSQWGPGLRAHAEDGVNAPGHGSAVRRTTGAGGAREEAAMGFPSIFESALPSFTRLRDAGVPFREAGIETLFLLIASVPDTNVIHRGGEEGGTFARKCARAFLQSGGIRNPGWLELALQTHREFIARNLSPGGAADLLAGTIFLHSLLVARQGEAPPTTPAGSGRTETNGPGLSLSQGPRGSAQ